MTDMKVGNFWRGLDRARACLGMGDCGEAERLLQELAAMTVEPDPAQGQRRAALLASFAETYGLAFMPAWPEPVSGHDPFASHHIVDLDNYIEAATPGVSLVTCCKNRNANLMRALPSWLAQDEIDQIVIVDWSSERSVAEDLARAGQRDPRIVIARVEGEPRWILSYAFNLGFRLARHAQILKADADIVLAPDFFAANPTGEERFVAGNWRTAAPGQEFINGFFLAPRETLMSIKGFNEHITTYGWDDDDIYERLKEAGLARRDVAPGTVSHLEHDDTERLGQTGAAKVTLGQDLAVSTMAKIRANRFIATIMPRWNGDRILMPYDLVEMAPERLVLCRRGDAPHAVPDHIESQARSLAALELLSWRLGPRAFELTPDRLDALLSLPRGLDELTREDLDRALAPAPAVVPARDRIVVNAQHGLGNRLRAWASGAAIAASTGRELLVVWEPDHHCECRLSDLFDYDGAVEEGCFLESARASGAQIVNYMEIEEGAEKDAPITLQPGRDLYARSAYVLNAPQTSWEVENAFLRGLRPTRTIREMMAGVPDHRDLALHVRMEGATGTDLKSYDAAENWTEEGHRAITHWRAQSHFGRFMERVDRVLAAEPDARIFLAADLPETYAAFRETYGPRVAVLERTEYDRSAAQIQSALADVLLLARCRGFLGSNWSSFSELAIRLSSSFAWHEMSGVDF